MSKKYNLRQLVSIEIYDSCINTGYTYVPSKVEKSFFGKNKYSPEGFVTNFGIKNQFIPSLFYTFEEIKSPYNFIKDNNVYSYPSVELKFSNGENVRKFFQIYDDAKKFRKKILKYSIEKDVDDILFVL